MAGIVVQITQLPIKKIGQRLDMHTHKFGLRALGCHRRLLEMPARYIPSPLLYSSNAKPKDDDDVFMRVKVQPIIRKNESMDKKRARLIYQSRKRGILETDLLLSRFAAAYLKDMSPEELEEYDSLLNELDWDIYYWATKNYKSSPLPNRWRSSRILERLQDFSQNKEKEILRMPTLDKFT